jgi:hypothetical protein
MIVCKQHSNSFAPIIEPYERSGFRQTLVTADIKLVFQLFSSIGPNDLGALATGDDDGPRACVAAMSTKTQDAGHGDTMFTADRELWALSIISP